MIRIANSAKRNIFAVLLIGFLAVAVYGQADFKPVADEMMSSSGISWVPKVNYAQLALTISRPDGTIFHTTFDSGSSPYVDLSSIFGSSYQDGLYTYELVVIPSVGQRVRSENTFSSSQAAGVQQQYPGGLTQSGSFTVQNGGIVTGNMTEATSPGPLVSTGQEGLSGTLDQVIADDLIVQMSLCVGVDCVNNENFGFDTVRLKENNLRIHFDDTSNSGSFPNTDWRITINDSANGGASYFRVDDASNSKSPFTIEANTASNMLYLDSNNRIGIGTSTPAVKLQVTDGNTPTLRLEQNGSSGFTAQSWDVAGNEANFFVRDVTHSSHLPFRIKPGAPEDSIYIDTDGVGFGTDNPSYAIHVLGGSSSSALLVVAENSQGATIKMGATSNQAQFGSISNHPLKLTVNNNAVVSVNTDNSLTLASGASCTDAGVWTNASSRELKENIRGLSTDEAIETLAGLNPVRYNYKVDKDEEYLGFIAEDVPEMVAMKDRKHMTPMDVVAVLTKVVQEQQKNISELKEKIAELKKK
jgi:hypothetical protein